MKSCVEQVTVIGGSRSDIAERDAPNASRAGLAALSLTMLMPSLATSIANAALPTLAHMFEASFQAAQWILLTYLLAITTVIIVAGRLGDLIGRRRLLLAGIVAFTTASLLCAVAPTLPFLIAARGLQGLGAAVMMALSMAFVGDIIPKNRMGRAMGLLGTTSAIGTTLGPSLGGLLLASAGWPSIFLINMPLGILALALVWRALPADPSPARLTRGGFDLLGMMLLLLSLGAYALSMTTGRGKIGPLGIGLFLVALVAGGCFVLAERKARSPLIHLTLLREPALRTGLVTSALISAVMMATLVIGPFYLSRVLGLGTALLGLALSVGPLVATVAGIPAGRFVDRIGADRVAVIGLVALFAGAMTLSLAPASTGLAGYLLPIMIMTGGYAMFQTANNSAVMAKASPEQRGLISAMLNLARNLGLVTGASAMGAVFALGVAGDIAKAHPAAVAAGMRITFGVASGLVALAFILTAVPQLRQGRP